MMLWLSAVGIRLANPLVLGSDPRMPPLESLESLESPEPSPELSSLGLDTVEASSWVSCWTRMSSNPSASW